MSDAAPAPPRGLNPAEFLAEYWQRKPLLLRGAMADWPSPIDADELAGLACELEVDSRLVVGPDADDDWQLEYGPFEQDRFASLPASHWTLLVQDLDKWLPEVGLLLERFSFLPSWRIDDVMASYAATGGSVGPHWDYYDVFLFQSAGRRRWLIDDSPNPILQHRPDQELKLLRSFEPTREWILEPGDLLYLPPEIPHHGISLDDDCLSYSVGMRAPAYAEMLVDLAETMAQGMPDSQRYTDPPLHPAPSPAHISQQVLQTVATAVRDLGQLDDTRIATWFGSFITRYRLPTDIEGERQWTRTETAGLIRSGRPLRRHPWSRWAYIERRGDAAWLFVNGQRYSTSTRLAEQLTAPGHLCLGEPDDDTVALLTILLNAGLVEAVEA